MIPTVDVAGCVPVTVTLNTVDSATHGAFYIAGACPRFAVNQSEFPVNASATTTVCLAPGEYTFVATASRGDGWRGGTFSVRLQDFAPIIPSSEVSGFGLRADFKVPEGVPLVHGGMRADSEGGPHLAVVVVVCARCARQGRRGVCTGSSARECAACAWQRRRKQTKT